MKLLVASALAATAVLGPMTATADAATCGTLPAVVQGNPHVAARSAGDAYLWHDGSAWSLRVTHPSTSRTVVSGTITASTGVRYLRAVKLEKGDAVTRSADGKTLAFRLSNYGAIDGFDFSAECSHAVHVVLKADGRSMPTTKVFLGAHRAHPTSVPFTVERH